MIEGYENSVSDLKLLFLNILFEWINALGLLSFVFCLRCLIVVLLCLMLLYLLYTSYVHGLCLFSFNCDLSYLNLPWPLQIFH